MSYHQPNNGSLVPKVKNIAVAPNSHAASRAKWNHLQPFIKQLYYDEDKSLKEVMEIMARDHHHYATPKMYKDRIKKWNLDKKIKEQEAWALLRKKLQREAIGKASNFTVRGRAITVDDVLRYFKRKGILDPETRPKSIEPPTPPVIKCWTPTPSPDLESNIRNTNYPGPWDTEPFEMSSFALGSTKDINSVGFFDSNQTSQILFSNPEIQSFEISPSPLPPENILALEKFFICLTTYFRGTLDNGFFITEDDGYLGRNGGITYDVRPADFSNLINCGTRLMKSNSFVEGRRCFSKASSIIGPLFRNQHPRMLEFLINSLSQIRLDGYNEIAILLQNYMKDISTLLFDDGHPWRQLFSQLVQIEESQIQIALIQAEKCINDTLSDILGEFHYTVLISHLESFYLRSYSNAPQLIHDLLLRAEQKLGKSDPRTVEIMESYGKALFINEQYADAIHILEEAIVHIKGLEEAEVRISYAIDRISRAKVYLGHYEAADDSRFQEVIRVMEDMYGESHSSVLILKSTLAIIHRALGDASAALEVQAEIGVALGPEDIELDS